MIVHETLDPPGWPRPKGYANGIKATGTIIVTGGQVGWNEHGEFAPDFVKQVAQTLRNVVAILAAGGAEPRHLVRLTWYVTDMELYRSSLGGVGQVYREIIGRTFPAMALVAVTSLVEPLALVEIEATAVLPD